MKRLAFVGLILCLLGAAPAPPPVDIAQLLADDPAQTLDTYRLFVDANAHMPNAGVTPYVLNTTLFSDYAEKFRYLYLPPGTKVTYRGEGLPDFPVGATLIKTFAYPADFRRPDEKLRYIETRLLIHRADGWVANTYVWNDTQDQATLKRAGERVDISFVRTDGSTQHIDYGVPNANQCKQCHSFANAVTPIGPKMRNLNRDYVYASGAENQIAHWTRAGLMAGAPSPASVSVLPRWDDPKLPVEARAKAYLDVNCGHCHNANGLASNSGLFLTYEENNPSVRGINKRPVAAGKGSGNLDFAIAPGHPEQSILLYRMESTEPGVMMPQIGRTLSDTEATQLVRDYILGLK